MWLVILLFVGPCVVIQTPLEIGRWRWAAALHARQEGDKERAYAELAAAMKWLPGNSLLAQRAEWRLADGRIEEGLADADVILEANPESAGALRLHGQLLQAAGRFEAAVEDWKKVDKLSERTGQVSRSTALNELAYAQALADVELDEALAHVNESLELLSAAEKKQGSEAAILDTRGYIQFLKGRYAEALQDLESAVRQMSEKRASLERVPPKLRKALSPEAALEARGYAVIYYHRALVYEALGKTQEAAADRARARELIGREPDETLF